MGFKQTIGVGLLYAGIVYLFSKCNELQCKLALKTAECQLYKAAYEAYTENDKSKEKGKIKLFTKKDEE